jgi:hypothetical protein
VSSSQHKSTKLEDGSFARVWAAMLKVRGIAWNFADLKNCFSK